MKQIVLEGPGKFFAREAPVPELSSSSQAIVRIRKVGVCGSDFHAFTGSHPIYTYPRVLGHELSGQVIEVESNEFGIKVGDLCAIEPYISCGNCRACKVGRTNCCERLQVIGIHVDGGMQDLLSVPVSLLHKSDKLSLEELALIETLGIGAHAVLRSDIKSGQCALIIGAGPIGLAVAEFARVAGADVHVVEKNEWRKSFALNIGIQARSELNGELADVVFDATGSAESMSRSLFSVAPAGRLVFVGLTKEPIAINDSHFHRYEVTIYASRNSRGQFPRIIRMLESGSINVLPWITDRMDLQQVPETFSTLFDRPRLIKAMVDVAQPGC